MELEGKIFSHYRILRLIGRGGMGEVYLAEDTQLKRQVAAKFLRMEMLQGEQEAGANALRLFWREATAIAQLDHPLVLPLYDHGEAMINDTSIAYLIMPYRPEGSLAMWLRMQAQIQGGGQLTFKQIAHVILQASQSLQYAHDHQVMHLDVKPANYLIRSGSATDDDPDLLLSDFGIARLENATSSISQHVRGTPLYMAPEQIEGPPTFASDQYALAIMAYELLTGSPPFQGTPLSIMFAHTHKQPRPVHELNPHLPEAVDLVLLRALAKKPEERFPSIAMFAQAFQAALLGGSEATPSPPVQARSSAPIATPQQEKIALLSTLVPQNSDGLIERASPQIEARSQEAITPPALPTPKPVKDRRSRPGIAILILLILILLGSASLGVYGVATGHWPWSTVRGQPTATQTGRGPQASATATASSTTNASGSIWHAQQSGTVQQLYSVAWSGTQFVAVGLRTILTSPDGRTWTIRDAGSSHTFWSIAWSGSQFVVVGSSGVVLTSPDGRAWTPQDAGYAQDLNNVIWSGSQFVAVGKSGAILTSPNGRTWTLQNAGSSQSFWGIAWSRSLFVVVGTNGTILTSSNGRIWTLQNAQTTQFLYGVTWSGSQFVAVGIGAILTSPDGRTWTTQDAAPAQSLNKIVWSGSQFVAVGTNGAILTSPDGRTWSFQSAVTSQTLGGVVWSGSQFVAVGDAGTILTSP